MNGKNSILTKIKLYDWGNLFIDISSRNVYSMASFRTVDEMGEGVNQFS